MLYGVYEAERNFEGDSRIFAATRITGTLPERMFRRGKGVGKTFGKKISGGGALIRDLRVKFRL